MDGDRYHKSLQMRYQQIYKQLGQAHFSPREIAYNTLRPLMKDLKEYGNDMVALLGKIADEIESRLALPVLRDLVDRDVLKQEIEQWTQTVVTGPRAKNLVLDACERYIDDLDLTTVVTGVRQELIAAYMGDVYLSNFEALASSAPGARKYSISHTAVRDQLPEVRGHLDQYIAQIAGAAAKKLSFDHVRMPEAPRANEVVALDEILSL